MSLADRVKNHDWELGLITVVAAIIGTILTFASGVIEIQTERDRIVFDQQQKLTDRIEVQSQTIQTLRSRVIQKEAEISVLNIRLAAKFDGLSTLFAVLESMKIPAWIKQYNPDSEEIEDEFIMMYINSDYEHAYNISSNLYVGRSDFEVFHRERAMQYYLNDKEVLKHKIWLEFVEVDAPRHMKTGSWARFWKFHTKLADGTEIIVGMRPSSGSFDDEGSPEFSDSKEPVDPPDVIQDNLQGIRSILPLRCPPNSAPIRPLYCEAA